MPATAAPPPRSLEQQIRHLESDIDDPIDGHPELKHDAELMRSLPDVDNRASAQFLSDIGDLRRFHSAKALAAFIASRRGRSNRAARLRGV